MAKKSGEVAPKGQSDAEIARILADAAEHEAQNKADMGGNRTPYIKCISDAEAAELDKTSPEYIAGAKYKGFCVPEHKLSLGSEFFCTVLGVFSVYEEKTEPKVKNEIPKIVGYWMPDQARQIPIADGGYFDRKFVSKDGDMHILSPVFWVFVLIKGHEDLGVHSITFRSTANENAKHLQKMIGAAGIPSCQWVFKVVAEKKEFPNFKKVIWRPLFEATNKFNFKVGANGKLTYGETNKEETADIVKLYGELQAAYNGQKLVSKHNVENAVAAIPETTSEEKPTKSSRGTKF